jgi:hypothetical protein
LSVSPLRRGSETGELAAAGRFAVWVESALGTGLECLASSPDLADLLVAQVDDRGEEADCRNRQWQGHCADLLRKTAASCDLSPHPPFLEPFLIAGSFSLVVRRLRAGKAEELERLLPDLLEFILAYYGPRQ